MLGHHGFDPTELEAPATTASGHFRPKVYELWLQGWATRLRAAARSYRAFAAPYAFPIDLRVDQDLERLLACVVETSQTATTRLYEGTELAEPKVDLPTVRSSPDPVRLRTFRALKREIDRRVGTSR